MSLEEDLESLEIEHDSLPSPDEHVSDEFDSENDKLNWVILCEAIDRLNVQVELLGGIVDTLMVLSDGFNYLGLSITWMRAQIKAVRKTPPRKLDRSRSQSLCSSEHLSGTYSGERQQNIEENTSLLKSRDILASDDTERLTRGSTSDTESDDDWETTAWGSGPQSEAEDEEVSNAEEIQEESDFESESDDSLSDASEDSQTNFRYPSTYDWSESKKDIKLVKEIILMTALMAVYDILEQSCVSESDMNELFSRPFLSDWNGSVDEALFQTLIFLSQCFEANDQNKHYTSFTGQCREENKPQDPPLMLHSQQYQHYPGQKLDSGRHEIRILELLPGLKDHPIKGLLSIASLDDAPNYEALSYVWGNPTTRKSMQLNEIEFSITSNLENALLHLRDKEKTQCFWIDALCINQNDLAEKQQQVQLMSSIFPRAQMVLCWLGPEEDDSSFVIHFLQELAAAGDLSNDESLTGEDSSVSSVGLGLEGAELKRLLSGLFQLLTRPWWSRLWTCQEFALTPRDPRLICGDDWIPWSSFARVVQKQDYFGKMIADDPMLNLDAKTYWNKLDQLGSVSQVLDLRTDRGLVHGLENRPNSNILFRVVNYTRYYQSTDPRDKIFAILSFLMEPHRALFPPNYEQELETVYTKYTAATLLLESRDSFYKIFTLGNSKLSLPSWVFDFSNQNLDGSYDPRIFSFRGYSNTSKGRDFKCLPIGTRLFVRGVLLNNVQTVYSILDGDDIEIHNIYTRLCGPRKSSQATTQRKLREEDPAYRIQHLRAKNPFINVVTAGLFSEKEFHEDFSIHLKEEGSLNIEVQLSNLQKDQETFISQSEATDGSSANNIPERSDSSSSSWVSDFEYDTVDFNFKVQALAGRTLFVTRSGFFGLGVKGVQEGDLIVLIFGVAIPFVLRDHGDYFSFVGGSRVGGIMDGELMEFVDDNTLQERTFCIR